MLDVPVFETEETETVNCAGNCGATVETDDDNYSNGQAYCGRIIGEFGYFCDDCYPRCYCGDCDPPDWD